jgi:hypothetical protein
MNLPRASLVLINVCLLILCYFFRVHSVESFDVNRFRTFSVPKLVYQNLRKQKLMTSRPKGAKPLKMRYSCNL